MKKKYPYNSYNKGGAMAPIIPTYYKSKGTPIYRDTTDAPPRILNHGGPHNPSPFNIASTVDTVKDIVEDHYQSMSLADYRKLQNDLKLKKAEYDAEHTRVEDVINRAHELGLELGTNQETRGEELRAKGKEYVYNPDTYQNELKDRTIQVANPQDWEAIGMDFINDPNNYLNNLREYEDGKPKFLEDLTTGIIPLDSEGNPLPELKQGQGCIGSQCGIYSTAGATNISDYKTGYGNQIAKAGDPIFKQLSNKFWDANNQAALIAAGFARVKEGDPIRRGTLARIEDAYTTEENPSYGHTVMVNRVNADGTGVDFDAEDGFIENPGNFFSGITTSSPYNSYKNRLHYYNYVGNEPRLKKEYEDLLAQQQAYKKYNQPVNIPLIKPTELRREGPTELNIKTERIYPDTRKGRKQKKKDLASNPSFKKGGFINSVKKQIKNSKKFVNGGETEDIGKGMAYEFWKNRTQPVDKFGRPNVNYQGPTTFRSLSNQVNAPIPTKADEFTNQYGYDYKKTYDESGTPHYYTKKEGSDSWIDLETEGNKNSLAAVKALAWGDDTSYIGSEAHLAQRQNEYDKQLKSKGEWLGPMEAEERKKLYNIKSDQEAPNMILSYAQDSDFINSIANFATISPGNVSEKGNEQIKRALLKGTHGFNPATGQLIKLSSLGEAGQSRIVDTKSLNDPYLNYTLEGVEGASKDPNFYDKRYKQEQKAAHKDLTDYINKRHLVHLEESDAWRGHMGAYPIFAEDVYTDDDGNVVFKDQASMEKRLSEDPVDLYNYGNRDVYMTNEEEEAYRQAMMQNNLKATYDHPLWSLPGTIAGFGSANIVRGAVQQGLKQLAKKEGIQAVKQVLKQPLLTNTLRGTKYAQWPAMNMLSPLQLADVAGGVYALNQFTDSDSMTRQSIRDYQQGKGSFGDAAFNVAMSGLSGLPVGSEILRQGYGNLIGGINAIRRVPQVRDFVPGMGQVLKGEAKFKDLFNTQKYTRFTKPGHVKSKTGNYWYNRVDGTDLGKYQKGADQATDLILTDARASEFNAAKIQDRINKGKRFGVLEEKAAKRSIAPIDDPRMVAYRKTITDPEKRKMFNIAVSNPDRYWKLPGYTDDIAELIAKAPANADELNLSKELFKDIKAYDAINWKPGYSLLADFSGSYGGSKAAALAKSKKVFDYIGKYSSKLSKIGKLETAGMDGYDFAEGNLIGGYNSDIFELKPKYKSPSKFDNYLNE